MKNRAFSLILVLTFLLFSSPLYAVWVWSPEAGRFINPDAAVQETPQEQYDYAMEAYKNQDLKEAVGRLRLLLKRYPGAQIAPEAQYRLGTIYEELRDYHRAFRAYRDLILRYPQSERMDEALEREFRIGNLFLSGSKGKIMGLAILPSGPRAVEIFKHIAEAAPYSQFGDKAQFHLGLAYKKMNRFEEAIQAFQGLLDRHPQSELVPQARFQIADTSYLQSVVATRDQRVMDRASEELDRFLTHYPSSSVSDKAARLRQEIDEKNAEKNYRIGLFYEKQNFLDSAFIYYQDVAVRYPHTLWGKKARERFQILERPADYLKVQEAEVLHKKETLLKEIRAVGNSDPARKKDLEWELKRVEKEIKEVQKSKPETIKRRLSALRLKEKSLKEKRKALQKKRKRYAKNPSEDLVQAFQRWEASLDKEEKDLAREKLQIQKWEKNLGVDTEPFYAQLVPFGKEAPSPLEQVQQTGVRRLEKMAREKREILMKKEALYHEYEKLLALEGLAGQPEPAFEAARRKLETQALEIKELEKRLEEKEALYKKNFGTPAWQTVFRVPTQTLGRSVDILNPFGREEARKDWENKSTEELKVLKDQWQEKIASQKALVEVISRAFDDELARAEEKRVVTQAREEEMDTTALRRNIKQIERQIRSYYNEIQDRDERKKELLEEVARVLQGREKEGGKARQAGRILTAPARGAYLFGRAFLFGLQERDVKLTQEADRRLAAQASEEALLRELKEQIELESLLIETRNQEILRLKRDVEALRAQSSLTGGQAIRPIFVKIPYVFVREAIVSANRLIPKKERGDKLINQLNRETAQLERLKRELAKIEDLLAAKEGKKGRRRTPPPAAPLPSIPSRQVPDQQVLQNEIRSLQKQLELQTSDYEYQRESFEKNRWDKISQGRDKARTKKIKEIEEDLIRLIEKEKKIQEEEKELLARKKEMAEEFLATLPSDLLSKELRREREQINSRLHELQNRETTLGEELKRFRPQTLPPS